MRCKADAPRGCPEYHGEDAWLNPKWMKPDSLAINSRSLDPPLITANQSLLFRLLLTSNKRSLYCDHEYAGEFSRKNWISETQGESVHLRDWAVDRAIGQTSRMMKSFKLGMIPKTALPLASTLPRICGCALYGLQQPSGGRPMRTRIFHGLFI
jgi:hypothetical protein